MAASCISSATSPQGFLIPLHRYLRDRQSEEQRAGGCLLPHGNACPREQGDGALANGTAAVRGGRRSRDSSESGTLLGVGPGLRRTTENSVQTKFGEFTFPRTPVNRERVGLESRGRGTRPYPARCFSGRTIKTGQWAWRTTESETLPISARLTPPKPRLPITMSPAPSSSAKWMMA